MWFLKKRNWELKSEQLGCAVCPCCVRSAWTYLTCTLLPIPETAVCARTMSIPVLGKHQTQLQWFNAIRTWQNNWCLKEHVIGDRIAPFFTTCQPLDFLTRFCVCVCLYTQSMEECPMKSKKWKIRKAGLQNLGGRHTLTSQQAFIECHRSSTTVPNPMPQGVALLLAVNHTIFYPLNIENSSNQAPIALRLYMNSM